MSDLFERYRPDAIQPPRPQFPEPPKPPQYGPGGGLTDAQRELIPYIEQVKAEKEKQGREIQPLQMLLDLLQRGQYLSANIVSETITSVRDDEPLGKDVQDVLQAAWQGITGERKGSYKDILVEQLGWEDRPGQMDWADVVGFAGDVLLDPLTYVGGIGATGGAKAAAKAYADDAIRLTAREFGQRLGTEADDLVKMARSTFDRRYFTDLRKTDPDAAWRYFVRNSKADVRRHFSDTYRDAYRHALHTPGEELRQELAERAGKVQSGIKDEELGRIQNLVDSGDLDAVSQAYAEFGQDVAKKSDFTTRLLKKVEDEETYSDAGKIAWRLFGHEVGERVGQTWVSRNWDVLRNQIKASKTGAKLSDAWWALMNKGPIGEIKAAFGIRNPYQTALRQVELEEGAQALKIAEYDNVVKVEEAIQGFDEETMDAFVRLSDYAEHEARSIHTKLPSGEELVRPAPYAKREGYTIFDVLEEPETLNRLGIQHPDKVGELATKVRNLTHEWFNEYKVWENEGLVGEIKEIINYLPAIATDRIRLRMGAKRPGVLGASTPGFAKQRTATRSAMIGQEKATLQWIFGLNDAGADMLIRKYHEAGITMDLHEMLLNRAYAQAKVAKRVNMIRQFREFGIPFHHVAEPLQSAMAKAGTQLQDMGLTVVRSKGLEGYLFDKEVGDILNRAASMVDPANFGLFRRLIHNYTMWWKGIVTMTTGFHARNFYSNQAVMFQKHGLKAWNPEYMQAGLAGVAYALRKTNPAKLLEQVGGDEKWLNMWLAKRYGNFSVRELADEALRRGVIAEAQMGFGAKGLVEKMKSLGEKPNLNPFSLKFVGRDVSYRVGSVVENWPRFQAFVMDYAGAAKKHLDPMLDDAGRFAADGDAFKYASKEAKKLLLDYEDLTGFERDVMKNIIPFYTWLRKSIAVQIDLALNYPELYSTIPKMMDAFEMDHVEVDRTILPEFMQQLGMFPAMETDEGLLGMFNPNFPMQEINKIPIMFEEGKIFPHMTLDELRDDIINAVHPGIKGFASMMTEKGYDFFYRRELDSQADAPLLIRYFVSRPKAMEMVDGLLRFVGKDDGLNARIDENGKLEIDARLAHNLENFVPLFRRLEDVILLGLEVGSWFGPGMEDALETFTQAQDDYEGVSQSFQVLSRWAGVKFFPLDTEDARDRYRADVYHEAVGRKREAERFTPGAIRRRGEYRDRLDQVIRKLGI